MMDPRDYEDIGARLNAMPAEIEKLKGALEELYEAQGFPPIPPTFAKQWQAAMATAMAALGLAQRGE